MWELVNLAKNRFTYPNALIAFFFNLIHFSNFREQEACIVGDVLRYNSIPYIQDESIVLVCHLINNYVMYLCLYVKF